MLGWRGVSKHASFDPLNILQEVKSNLYDKMGQKSYSTFLKWIAYVIGTN